MLEKIFNVFYFYFPKLVFLERKRKYAMHVRLMLFFLFIVKNRLDRVQEGVN